jgi:hypothetical protein
MGNLQDAILDKQNEITSHRNDLAVLYSDLGKTVAGSVTVDSLGYCSCELETFRGVESRCREAEQAYGRLKVFVAQLEDRSRKIKQIEADIKALRAPSEALFSRLGAIAYESFGAGTLPDVPRKICSPFFEGHSQRTVMLEHAMETARNAGSKAFFPVRLQARISGKILERKLERQRKRVLPRFMEAGKALVEAGSHGEVPGIAVGSLLEEISHLEERREELDEELAIHRVAVAKLKDQEVESPRRKLEQSKARYEACTRERDKAAEAYGKALYETLPRDIPVDSVGEKAYALLSQIALHWRRIGKLESEILGLQNMIKAEELEAQIMLDNQKIEHLNDQIQGATRQINQIRRAIEAKRQQIDSLLPKQSLEYDGQ